MENMDAADEKTEGPKRPAMSRKEFLEKVMQKAGDARRSEVRTIVEATLATLGEVMAGGSDVDASPLGKLRVVREKDTERAKVLNLRLTISSRPRGERRAAALAEASEAE